MAQKLFTVHRNCHATIDIEVAAENEEEAMKIARQRFENIPGNSYDFTENDVSIIDTQDAPDVDNLITLVVVMMSERQLGSVYVSVDVHHTSYEYSGGRVAGEIEHLDRTEELYIDDGNLYVSYENDYSERDLDDEPLEDLDIEDQISILTDALNNK